MAFVYEVVSEDLTQLGAMWARPGHNWTKFASNLKVAKQLAEKDFGEKITWTKHDTYYCSGDLRYVMYNIVKVKVH